MSHTRLVLPERDHAAKSGYDKEIMGDSIEVTFRLSNGQTVTHQSTMGETIAQLKKYIQDNHNIPFHKLAMTLDGETLIDPLSLNDYPKIVGQGTISIDVQIAPDQGDIVKSPNAASKYTMAAGAGSAGLPGAMDSDSEDAAHEGPRRKGMGSKQKTVTFNEEAEEMELSEIEEEEKKKCCTIL